jgi:hypothetical protein
LEQQQELTENFLQMWENKRCEGVRRERCEVKIVGLVRSDAQTIEKAAARAFVMPCLAWSKFLFPFLFAAR